MRGVRFTNLGYIISFNQIFVGGDYALGRISLIFLLLPLLQNKSKKKHAKYILLRLCLVFEKCGENAK